MEKNTSNPHKGLHQDNSYISQPKDTYTYALNAVNDTKQGDFMYPSNEESNEECAKLPDGYTPLGKIYVGDGNTLIMSVSGDETTSEFGIKDKDCNYTTIINDAESPEEDKLNFKLAHQIDATFRLRRGCERTVYFTDAYNRMRYVNLDKLDSFKTNGNWDASKFELIRSYDSVPTFEDIEVLNSGGQLPPSGINVAIQYLDENLNPTEWITTSEVVVVYNDDTTNDFLDIEGSVNIEAGADIEDYRTFGLTDKAIKVDLGNLDESFLYYRLAFIEASTGSGLITAVKYTENIPTTKNFFIYTGENFATLGTEAEIAAFNSLISTVESVEQIENRLILGGVKGKQVNFCKLQKYASRIQADMVTKKVFTNVISDPNNSKNPTVRFGDKLNPDTSFDGGVGYMPGEIYSFGIVYVLADGTVTPVYHIPGKNPGVQKEAVFSPGDNTFPMDNNNSSLNNTYIDNTICDSDSGYWGHDSEGQALKEQPVRHHRFPLRSDFNMPLVTREEGEETTSEIQYKQIKLITTGVLEYPDCTSSEEEAGTCTRTKGFPFQIRVTFTVDGEEDYVVLNVDPINETENPTEPFLVQELSNFIVSDNILITAIEEADESGAFVTEDVTGPEAPSDTLVTGGPSAHAVRQLTHTVTVEDAVFTAENRIYSTEIFGIKFSNVEKPPTSDLNGEEIVGYYIVRNERTEAEKTVLDSAVLTPSFTNSKYVSHGLLGVETPTDQKISKDAFGLIYPEHKFNNLKYENFTDILQQGEFKITDRKKSRSRYRDVLDGSSYDSSVHKSGGGKDSDGWSLKAITRDNITEYKTVYENFDFEDTAIEKTFYLNALESKNVKDDTQTIYNIAADNKIGILELKNSHFNTIRNKFPYVYLRRDIADSYSTFRTLTYYKTSINMNTWGEGETYDITEEYGGDTYVTPMRYLNSVFWDNRIAERAGRTSFWNYIIGGLLAVIGAVLLIFGGTGAVVIGAGIALIGGGALFVSSGIKRDNLVRAYNEEYDKGLRETALDDWVDDEYKYRYSRASTPEDDEIQWIGDCITDLWFESKVNISLRYGMSSDVPTHLNAPGKIEEGRPQSEELPYYEHFSVYKIRDRFFPPFTELDKHMMAKLAVFSPERDDSREYIGHPLGEWYEINPDFTRINSQKFFTHLPLEYDCCSDCQEDFPHRVHYSQQSFQEELTDNYRVFLPNNYRDIEGETGKITDLFRIKSNLYIQTEESLWHLPQNFQERITNDIVSFIGAGEFFNIPPRKILDENQASGGSSHRWATIKTKYGVFFISEKEKKVYKFDGNQLVPISDLGLGKWFKRNAFLRILKEYYDANGGEYPFNNNPSNDIGIGFISTYDTENERLIFTKKDYALTEDIIANDDFEIAQCGGQLTIFNNFQQIINSYAESGWIFSGIEDCEMKFTKTTFQTQTVDRELITPTDYGVALDTIVIPFFDSSSMSGSTISNISDTIDAWFPGFVASINGGNNNITLQNPGTWNIWSAEDWVVYPAQTTLTQIGTNKNVLLLVFVDETHPKYHGSSFVSSGLTSPTSTYIANVNLFVNSLHSLFASFKAINYPIVKTDSTNKEYLQHTIAAIEAKNMTQEEVDALSQNPNFSTSEWDDLKTNLQSNPYVGQPILKDYGWTYREDRVDGVDNNLTDECSETGYVISPCQFELDIFDSLTDGLEDLDPYETEEITTDILVPVVETISIAGETINKEDLFRADNSWTISFSLKMNSWTSWHSYMPNFYFYLPDQFYSWQHGSGNHFWRHGRIGHYQTFYGERFPFVLELVSLSNPIKTRIWDAITLHTEAKKWYPDMEQYADERFKTFNKAIFYNTRQCSGILNMEVKDTNLDDENYLMQQITDTSADTVIIDRNERNWSMNDIRDIRVDYSQPIFRKDIDSLQSEYFTDKVLNTDSLDVNKDWTELESFRDKFLVIRLIFDTFDDIKLIMNYSIEDENESFR